MKSGTCIILAFATLTAGTVFAQSETAPASGDNRPAVAAGASETVMATVEAVNQETREVTLRKEDGEVVTIHVGDAARNLAQVEPGDRVTATYAVGLVLALGPPGSEPMRIEDTQTARTPLGAKPGGAIERTIAVTATIVGVNTATRTVTLKGPRQTVSLPVADDVDLSHFQVGDQVGAVYRESYGLLVEPAQE
jgi:Cu/Ag efflux protein CusF